jgi:2-hydroxy-6-oxonona-2,4-dienedioate hydrolase
VTAPPSFQSRRAEALGLRLHVRIAGSGPPVVLLHGLGVSGTYFEPLGRHLARTRRVVVPDLPGWGRSERTRRPLGVEGAAAVLGGLVRLVGAPLPVVANSYGAQVALALAAAEPGLVERLVLIGPTVDPVYRAWSTHAWRLAVDAARERPSLWPTIALDYARMGPRRVLATARAALRDRPEARAPQVEAPVLVLRGEHDAITTEAWCRRLAASAPHGRFVQVDGAAHAAHVSRAPVVAGLVEGFLAE